MLIKTKSLPVHYLHRVNQTFNAVFELEIAC